MSQQTMPSINLGWYVSFCVTMYIKYNLNSEDSAFDSSNWCEWIVIFDQYIINDLITRVGACHKFNQIYINKG